MLKITSAEFIISAASTAQFPKSFLPEIAFVGRSNVGKSSLLNTLVSRKNLAKTSGTPGKTQQINFFLINEQFRFVDLPGYGYAKVAKTEREAWARIIEAYLSTRAQLKLVVALSDIRHETPQLDRSMFAWLESTGRDFVIVLTKHDKVSPAQAEERRRQVVELTASLSHCTGVIPFSSTTRFNLDRLVGAINGAI
jgi:GTP-binding protein